jgi:hypothetical protein
MRRPTQQDGCGLVIAAALTTSPLFVVTWFGDHMSKDGPIGPPAYILPAAIGLSAAIVASAAAVAVGRPSADRFGLHAGFGCLASLALIVSFCAWWGDWCFRFAERFRG